MGSSSQGPVGRVGRMAAEGLHHLLARGRSQEGHALAGEDDAAGNGQLAVPVGAADQHRQGVLGHLTGQVRHRPEHPPAVPAATQLLQQRER